MKIIDSSFRTLNYYPLWIHNVGVSLEHTLYSLNPDSSQFTYDDFKELFTNMIPSICVQHLIELRKELVINDHLIGDSNQNVIIQESYDRSLKLHRSIFHNDANTLPGFDKKSDPWTGHDIHEYTKQLNTKMSYRFYNDDQHIIFDEETLKQLIRCGFFCMMDAFGLFYRPYHLYVYDDLDDDPSHCDILNGRITRMTYGVIEFMVFYFRCLFIIEVIPTFTHNVVCEAVVDFVQFWIIQNQNWRCHCTIDRIQTYRDREIQMTTHSIYNKVKQLETKSIKMRKFDNLTKIIAHCEKINIKIVCDYLKGDLKIRLDFHFIMCGHFNQNIRSFMNNNSASFWNNGNQSIRETREMIYKYLQSNAPFAEQINTVSSKCFTQSLLRRICYYFTSMYDDDSKKAKQIEREALKNFRNTTPTAHSESPMGVLYVSRHGVTSHLTNNKIQQDAWRCLGYTMFDVSPELETFSSSNELYIKCSILDFDSEPKNVILLIKSFYDTTKSRDCLAETFPFYDDTAKYPHLDYRHPCIVLQGRFINPDPTLSLPKRKCRIVILNSQLFESNKVFGFFWYNMWWKRYTIDCKHKQQHYDNVWEQGVRKFTRVSNNNKRLDLKHCDHVEALWSFWPKNYNKNKQYIAVDFEDCKFDTATDSILSFAFLSPFHGNDIMFSFGSKSLGNCKFNDLAFVIEKKVCASQCILSKISLPGPSNFELYPYRGEFTMKEIVNNRNFDGVHLTLTIPEGDIVLCLEISLPTGVLLSTHSAFQFSTKFYSEKSENSWIDPRQYPNLQQIIQNISAKCVETSKSMSETAINKQSSYVILRKRHQDCAYVRICTDCSPSKIFYHPNVYINHTQYDKVDNKVVALNKEYSQWTKKITQSDINNYALKVATKSRMSEIITRYAKENLISGKYKDKFGDIFCQGGFYESEIILMINKEQINFRQLFASDIKKFDVWMECQFSEQNIGANDWKGIVNRWAEKLAKKYCEEYTKRKNECHNNKKRIEQELKYFQSNYFLPCEYFFIQNTKL